ncbi:MAG TPA: 16S rRNA (guanine(527)-N(7))-methyltransferase RsmG [Thermoanaerobaculaceae bacterium]|nr:16S rRNA (guanine(527)-N(7))-methyltransferase RsmG [Thermoanaerobaculaceae bacterium]HRS17792.1 16S rRNA (guanine(527)-N(7))-methyltransferase RsmG [Thermoanaerobaculaceae bacterium]
MNCRRDRPVDGAPPASVLVLETVAQERLQRYVVLLERWSRAANLVSVRLDRGRLWGLVEESLAGAAHLPGGARFLDVGSGAGIPAIPLLVARPDLEGVLLEARERRWAFLREAARELDLRAEVRRQRLEDLEGEHFDAITARGVDRGVWEGAAARLLRPGGVVVWWTGEDRAREAELPGRVLICPMRGAGKGAVLVWTGCFT